MRKYRCLLQPLVNFFQRVADGYKLLIESVSGVESTAKCGDLNYRCSSWDHCLDSGVRRGDERHHRDVGKKCGGKSETGITDGAASQVGTDTECVAC